MTLSPTQYSNELPEETTPRPSSVAEFARIQKTRDMTQAILLVGHGTRHETGTNQFLRLAEHLRVAVAPLPLEVAFIELQSPTIEEALVSLYARGLQRILLSPALLFAAGHAKHDIPAGIAVAQERCSDLQVTCAEPLGCHEAILELAAERYLTSLASVLPGEGLPSSSLSSVLRGEGRGEGPASQIDPTTATALVLIGRGSSDPTAIAHCRDFATQLAFRVQANQVFTGFIAIAKPSLPEALELAAASGCQQIVVQPHLLFAGEMQETTTAAVLTAQQKHPQLDWREAAILGSDLLDPASLAADYLVRALRSRM